MIDFSFVTYNELSEANQALHVENTTNAYPEIIGDSAVVKGCWPKLGAYFPSYQSFAVTKEDELVGFVNTIPIFYRESMDALPEEGWDWLIQKGVTDFEKGISPNCLGGLQINISQRFRSQGLSKYFIAKAKEIRDQHDFKHLIIPIRPAAKASFQEMDMESYIDYKIDGKMYDPWIRTHVSRGAEIIKVCHNSMNIQGDKAYWTKALGQPLKRTGSYYAAGCLNEIVIDVERDFGEYREDNIWILYA